MTTANTWLKFFICAWNKNEEAQMRGKQTKHRHIYQPYMWGSNMLLAPETNLGTKIPHKRWLWQLSFLHYSWLYPSKFPTQKYPIQEPIEYRVGYPHHTINFRNMIRILFKILGMHVTGWQLWQDYVQETPCGYQNTLVSTPGTLQASGRALYVSKTSRKQ